MGDVEREQLAEIARIVARYPQVLWHHCRDSRHCDGPPGLPDLLFAGPGGLMMPELKASTLGRSPGQTSWKWTLRAAGVYAPLWTQRDFPSGVEREIAAISTPP